MRRLFSSIFALTLAVGAAFLPAQAQNRAEADSARLALLQTEQAHQKTQALAWARERSLPSTFRSHSGRAYYLARIEGNRPVYWTTHNTNAALLTRTVDIQPGGFLGLELSGAGLALGIWDAGVVLESHQEFAGRLFTLDDVPDDFHATHVGGTLAAAGVRVPARGMAFDADLRSYDWENDLTEMANEARRGLLLSNHSYGPVAGWAFGEFDDAGTSAWYWFGDPAISTTEDYTFGYYDQAAAQYDAVVAAHPFLLPVVSSGNDRTDNGPGANNTFGFFVLDRDGNWVRRDTATRDIPSDGSYDSIAGQAIAKNVLTVGSVGAQRVGLAQLSDFSSIGPTDDGRIKPDLVGAGEAIFSTSNNGNTGYAFNNGTSMATANVTGSLGLLQQHHLNLRGRALRAASLKALALHTAIDLGNPGPDYQYGWGLLNAASAIEHLDTSPTNPIAVVEGSLSEGEVFSRTVTLPEDQAIRVTLAWTDPPGLVLEANGPSVLNNPSPRLIHDLDLRLIHEVSGTIYTPFVLNPNNPSDWATTGDNTRDNVEQVYVASPTPGSYRLEVRHKGRLAAPQAYSLMVSGVLDTQPTVALGPFEATVTLDGIQVAWTALNIAEAGTFVLERVPLTFRAGLPPLTGTAERVAEIGSPSLQDSRADYSFIDPDAAAGWQRYRLYFSVDGIETLLGEVDVRVPVPERFNIAGNYPNPFTSQTELLLELPREGEVTVTIHDLLGREVAWLTPRVLGAGRQSLSIDGTAWTPGVYLAVVSTSAGTRSHRLVLIR